MEASTEPQVLKSLWISLNGDGKTKYPASLSYTHFIFIFLLNSWKRTLKNETKCFILMKGRDRQVLFIFMPPSFISSFFHSLFVRLLRKCFIQYDHKGFETFLVVCERRAPSILCCLATCLCASILDPFTCFPCLVGVIFKISPPPLLGVFQLFGSFLGYFVACHLLAAVLDSKKKWKRN